VSGDRFAIECPLPNVSGIRRHGVGTGPDLSDEPEELVAEIQYEIPIR
jgi:hypothetical protein